ncbi:fibrous sheath CABYR-binding protein isoform X9 [Drosophila kikkawai]|uniref:Fibrous sheath CABYR-binding protein isoform X9 n=1 Tax=Drosophila kikkawai TaxID=30033 RepID=A0ABM3C5Q6_DROKI|nr:LIM domain-binding protein 3 isoform X3 [Drosophila kikkawai]
MVLDIKMCRFDNVPWGFRLVGGSDYDYPLMVVKVTEGSIAEEAGLRVEDIIVRINDTAATPLTHDEAHRLIMNSGSVFYFGVYRENEEDAYECLQKFPTSEGSLTKSPTPLLRPSPTPSPSQPQTLTLLQLTEATNARTPEPETHVPAAADAPAAPALEFAAVQAVDVSVTAECRPAMSEVHSEDNRGDVPAEAEEVEVVAEAGAGQGLEAAPGLYLPDLPDRPCSALSERAEIKLVEEEIAAVLSGESEVLKEHNVLGIFPKPGVCMSSDVLRSLNEEVTKTKLEKDKENRKWSTFLQRPNRPVPKSKQQLEAERRAANAYKVTIVKSAPRDKSPMPEAKPAPKEATPPKEEEKEEEVTVAVPEPEPEVEKEEEPLPTDSEVPNLEQLPESELPPDEQPEKGDAEKEASPEEASLAGTEAGEATAVTGDPASPSPPTEPIAPPKTEEELALERQLADVQRQLAALSSLPSTIQSTLDAVTKQLAELLPTFKLQQQERRESQEGQELPQIDEKTGSEPEEDDAGKAISISGTDKDNQANNHCPAGPCESNEDRCDANDREVAEISRSTDDNRLAKDKSKDTDAERDWAEQPVSEEQGFRKQKIAFWNRLFNGEHITRQRFRELQGLGQSLTMQKVNFMKYQKPERKIDLNRSEVYKYLNPHLDRAPVRGIEVRAPLVAAESDIRQSLQS